MECKTIRNMNKKKIIERHQLTKFISNTDLKLKVVSIIDNETPDFIITSKYKRISVELTELTNPEVKKVESYRNKIIKVAEQMFIEKYKTDLYVLITFENVILSPGKAEERYAKELFEIIEKEYLTSNAQEFSIVKNRMNTFIRRLRIANNRELNNWQRFGAYHIDWIKPEWMTKRIIRKQENISKYAEKFDENWLLLISNTGSKSSANRFDYVDFKEIQTDFERVYVYKYIENETIQIK